MPSISSESDSLEPARAVMARVLVTAGTISSTPTSRIDGPSAAIRSANSGFSGGRLTSREEPAEYGSPLK